MTQPITPAELAELRRLSEAADAAHWPPSTPSEARIIDEVPRLLDEIERLRGELSRAQGAFEGATRSLHMALKQAEEALAAAHAAEAELAKRPKLWVVRHPCGVKLRGSVDIGDCGDAAPCIAAFDRETDAAYVAACIGGTVEEWGAK
jgi:hypothetical protein